MRNHPMWRAGYWEWEASLFGALLIAMAAGAIFRDVVMPLAGLAIVTGIPIHFWGMYRVYRQNPTPHETIIGHPLTNPIRQK